MTPVQDWTYADYYAAIDRARWAWQQTNPQFVLFDAGALADADAYAPRGAGGDEGVGLVERTLTAGTDSVGTTPTQSGARPEGNDGTESAPAVSVVLNPERVPASASPLGDALSSGAEPCHAPLQGQTAVVRRVVDGQQPSSAPSLTTKEADAKSPQTERVRLQEGA